MPLNSLCLTSPLCTEWVTPYQIADKLQKILITLHKAGRHSDKSPNRKALRKMSSVSCSVPATRSKQYLCFPSRLILSLYLVRNIIHHSQGLKVKEKGSRARSCGVPRAHNSRSVSSGRRSGFVLSAGGSPDRGAGKLLPPSLPSLPVPNSAGSRISGNFSHQTVDNYGRVNRFPEQHDPHCVQAAWLSRRVNQRTETPQLCIRWVCNSRRLW